MSNQLSKIPNERYLYKNESSGMYYLRKRTSEVDTDECLKTTRISVARKMRDDWMLEQHRTKNGNCSTGQPASNGSSSQTETNLVRVLITSLLDLYRDAGYPHKGTKREDGHHLRGEVDNVETLRRFFKDRYEDELDQDLLDQYHDWRLANVTKGEGHRTTDLELNTLSNALKWAVRKKKIGANRIEKRDRYYHTRNARHAKDVCPKSPEELHDVIRELFRDPRSESLGWQGLIEAATGLRTEEAVGLVMKAGPGDPGFLMGDNMLVRRAEKSELVNPFVILHADLRIILEAHKKWHALRYPNSPWFFPGREKEEGKPVALWSLTSALDRLHRKTKRRKKRKIRKITSHGMRAYYVLVRRSNGIHDSQIAVELNQIGDLETLRTSYGVVPPEWLLGKGPKLTWLPSDPAKYAWNVLPAFKQPADKAA
jgi:hypothetical protein